MGANKFVGMTQRQPVDDQTVSLLTCAVTLRNKAAIKALINWTVQDSGGRLTPEREKIRQQVIQELEAKGIHFPVPRPATYRWDPITRTFSLPSR